MTEESGAGKEKSRAGGYTFVAVILLVMAAWCAWDGFLGGKPAQSDVELRHVGDFAQEITVLEEGALPGGEEGLTDEAKTFHGLVESIKMSRGAGTITLRSRGGEGSEAAQTFGVDEKTTKVWILTGTQRKTGRLEDLSNGWTKWFNQVCTLGLGAVGVGLLIFEGLRPRGVAPTNVAA